MAARFRVLPGRVERAIGERGVRALVALAPFLALLLSCSTPTPRTSPAPEAPTAPAPSGDEPAAAETNPQGEAPATDPPTSTVHSPDGTCDPMPHEGDPCEAGDGYCVITWGTPGGWSSALWCRDGRWEIEEERNLP